MLRHVVLWTFKDAHEGTDKPAIIAKVVALLRRCEAEVPSLRTFELGGAADGLETTYDLILVSSFDDAAGLQAYVEHPVHQEASAYIGQVRVERVCMDYLV